jgi:DNA topoisomerase-1
MNLVIVESPTKAKTLNKFLGKDYEVMASAGHVRDLPSNKMNIDIDHDFKPHYELSEGKEQLVKKLASTAKKAKAVYLAMDPDREGEAIAYHVEYLLKKGLPKDKEFKRITFHQITKNAVEEAIAHAGKIDKKLVDAQQARRVLDRLVGYSLSPVLWRKVRRGLSAGRVQSVALRLVVEREREIEAFKPQEYWEVGVLVKPDGKEPFWVSLNSVEGKAIEAGKGDQKIYTVNSEKVVVPIVADLKSCSYKVAKVEKKEKKQSPKPPYTTSTLQQAAANAFGWTAKRTMTIAQQLYERGLITYHRTDSLNLANEAVAAARSMIETKYGPAYLPASPRYFKTKSKNAQEAHEAIRPTNADKDLKELNGDIDAAQAKLYQLIWRRFVSCQMADAIFDATRIDVEAKGHKTYGLKATGAVMKFAGWKIVYGNAKRKAQNSKPELKTENSDASNSKTEDETILPDVVAEEKLVYKDLHHEQKFTQPPPRYNDASIVKKLEELGIGRPSTYAPTIGTLISRAYMERKDRKFYPTAVGLAVVDFLSEYFKTVMDYGFTAKMEDSLDEIALGNAKWVPVIREFWNPFNKLVGEVTKNSKRVEVPVEKTGKPCPLCGDKEKGEIIIRTGRFGKFYSCSRFPECKYTANFKQTIEGMKCEKCQQGDVVIKRTRTGRTFYGCSRYPECDWASWADPRKKTEAEQGEGVKLPQKV